MLDTIVMVFAFGVTVAGVAAIVVIGVRGYLENRAWNRLPEGVRAELERRDAEAPDWDGWYHL